jgi:hypothetical protein
MTRGLHIIVATGSWRYGGPAWPSEIRTLSPSQFYTDLSFEKRDVLMISLLSSFANAMHEGVARAGAMRPRGTHAIAFLGRRHFDDPRLLEKFLQPLGFGGNYE